MKPQMVKLLLLAEDGEVLDATDYMTVEEWNDLRTYHQFFDLRRLPS